MCGLRRNLRRDADRACAAPCATALGDSAYSGGGASAGHAGSCVWRAVRRPLRPASARLDGRLGRGVLRPGSHRHFANGVLLSRPGRAGRGFAAAAAVRPPLARPASRGDAADFPGAFGWGRRAALASGAIGCARRARPGPQARQRGCGRLARAVGHTIGTHIFSNPAPVLAQHGVAKAQPLV